MATSKTTLRIGVVGYSAGKFDEAEAIRLLNKGFDEALQLNPGATKVVIVTGYTDLGIPALAYRIAEERGWFTVGVASGKAAEHPCFPVDLPVIVGMEWGAESEAFLSTSDVYLRVGGGDQAHTEIAQAKESGRPVIEYELDREPQES